MNSEMKMAGVFIGTVAGLIGTAVIHESINTRANALATAVAKSKGLLTRTPEEEKIFVDYDVAYEKAKQIFKKEEDTVKSIIGNGGEYKVTTKVGDTTYELSTNPFETNAKSYVESQRTPDEIKTIAEKERLYSEKQAIVNRERQAIKNELPECRKEAVVKLLQDHKITPKHLYICGAGVTGVTLYGNYKLWKWVLETTKQL